MIEQRTLSFIVCQCKQFLARKKHDTRMRAHAYRELQQCGNRKQPSDATEQSSEGRGG